MVVPDASIVLPAAFSDEQRAAADAVIDRVTVEGGVAPAIWWFEVRNALLMGERRGRLKASQTTAFLARLARLRIEIDRFPAEVKLLALARQHRLTVYDAAYLELAVRVGATLATGDAALMAAARREGVPLFAAG